MQLTELMLKSMIFYTYIALCFWLWLWQILRGPGHLLLQVAKWHVSETEQGLLKWLSDFPVVTDKLLWAIPSNKHIPHPIDGVLLATSLQKIFPGVTNPLDLNHLENVAMLFVHIVILRFYSTPHQNIHHPFMNDLTLPLSLQKLTCSIIILS